MKGRTEDFRIRKIEFFIFKGFYILVRHMYRIIFAESLNSMICNLSIIFPNY